MIQCRWFFYMWKHLKQLIHLRRLFDTPNNLTCLRWGVGNTVSTQNWNLLCPFWIEREECVKRKCIRAAACNCRATQCYCSILIILAGHGTWYIGTYTTQCVRRAFNLSQHSNQNDIICFCWFRCAPCFFVYYVVWNIISTHAYTHMNVRTKLNERANDGWIVWFSFYDGTLS